MPVEVWILTTVDGDVLESIIKRTWKYERETVRLRPHSVTALRYIAVICESRWQDHFQKD